MLTALVVAALFVTPAAALGLGGSPQAAQATTTAQGNTTATNATIQPGEQLAGVVGVQGAEIDGEIEGRAYGHAVAAARNNNSKASVVADQVERLETRLTELRERRDSLQEAHANGSLQGGQYRAQMATVAARIGQVERQLNQSQQFANGLPENARSAAGLNVSALETLRTQAHEMRGGEVAEIARSVAGRGVGRGPAHAGGPPADAPGQGNGPDNPGQGNAGEGNRGQGNQGQGNAGAANETRTNNGQGNGGPPEERPGNNRQSDDGEQTTTVAPDDGGQSDGDSEQTTDRRGNGGQSGNGGPPDDRPGRNTTTTTTVADN